MHEFPALTLISIVQSRILVTQEPAAPTPQKLAASYVGGAAPSDHVSSFLLHLLALAPSLSGSAAQLTLVPPPSLPTSAPPRVASS